MRKATLWLLYGAARRERWASRHCGGRDALYTARRGSARRRNSKRCRARSRPDCRESVFVARDLVRNGRRQRVLAEPLEASRSFVQPHGASRRASQGLRALRRASRSRAAPLAETRRASRGRAFRGASRATLRKSLVEPCGAGLKKDPISESWGVQRCSLLLVVGKAGPAQWHRFRRWLPTRRRVLRQHRTPARRTTAHNALFSEPRLWAATILWCARQPHG